MHRRAGHQSAAPQSLLVVAALLAVLSLLGMHTLLAASVAAGAATSPEAGHAAHEHTHPDDAETPHSHPGVKLEAQLSSRSGSGSTGQPCTSCPGCSHETASVCALTPAKAGTSHLLLSVSDLAPAPHQLASWPDAGSYPPPATSAPPSLVALSISRT